MKFNHTVERNAKTVNSIDEHINTKKDPYEVLGDLEDLIVSTKRTGKREEIELADKFKQRVIHDFEREGRHYSKAWITRLTHMNTTHADNIIHYIARMKQIDSAFNQMKKANCEMDIEELAKSVKKSYTENNACIATLAGVEGDTIEIQGKLNREREELVADLENISRLNNTRQVDEETRQRIENYINTAGYK